VLEYQVVDTAIVFPHTCVCGNQKGPFLDTFIENGVGRVYWCKSCARRAARQFGFAPGKKLDELQDASAELERKAVEIGGLLEQITGLQLECGTERRTVKELRERVQAAEGRLQSIEHLAANVERGARELVEAVAPAPVLESVA
jgi:hypothetical protein